MAAAPADRDHRFLGLRLSPITRRRLYNFRANKRGLWSLYFFLAVFLITLSAEFIANDKPLLVGFDGQLFVPVLVAYPETRFNGEFPTEAEYRDPFVQELILGRDVDGDGFVEGCAAADPAECPRGWMLWPPIRFSYDTINYDLDQPAPSPPSPTNWLGTDDQARDVMARLIYGLRISILFGLTLTVLATVIGVIAGAVQGYFGGWVDLVFQRIIEIWSAMPSFFVLIILASILVPGFWTLLGILLLFSWIGNVGVVRAEFLRARTFDYIRAARALGQPDRVIMFKHVLPNAMVATITFLPFTLTASITALTGLDFLGLGMPPGSPSMGEMVQQGKNNIQAPWLGFTAFFSLAILLSLLVFIGEALRDAFDPRKAVGAVAGLPAGTRAPAPGKPVATTESRSSKAAAE